MIRGIDHLVIACADPDAAAAELTDALGLTVPGGGRHDGRGTFNRIAWLADGSYLELIGVDDREAALRQPVGAASVRALDEAGGGLATFALVDDAVAATSAALAGSGSSVGDVTRGSRTRPDGELVEWWTAMPATPLAADAPPFLIQHGTTGAEWGSAALAGRAAYVHPIGSPVTLVGIDVATDDPLAAAAAVHAELGLDVHAVADLAVCQIGPHVLRYRPRREMPVPAVVRLGAAIDAPRTVEILGLRFDVARAALPVAVV
jgi:catechol 2,3-dioxygenase-like lactoylglutathione lyase family enzyme